MIENSAERADCELFTAAVCESIVAQFDVSDQFNLAVNIDAQLHTPLERTWRKVNAYSRFSQIELDFITRCARILLHTPRRRHVHGPSLETALFDLHVFVRAGEFDLLEQYCNLFRLRLTIAADRRWCLACDTPSCFAIDVFQAMHDFAVAKNIVVVYQNRHLKLKRDDYELFESVARWLMAHVCPHKCCRFEWTMDLKYIVTGFLNMEVLGEREHMFDLLFRYHDHEFATILLALQPTIQALELDVAANATVENYLTKFYNDVFAHMLETKKSRIAHTSRLDSGEPVWLSLHNRVEKFIDIEGDRMIDTRQKLSDYRLRLQRARRIMKRIVLTKALAIAGLFASDVELGAVVALLLPNGLVDCLGEYTFARICAQVYTASRRFAQ